MKKQEEQKPYYRRLLIDEFEARRAKNRRYSLRAFSRFLNMDPAALCRIMADKQDLSPRSCTSLISKLGLSSASKHLFLQSLLEDRKQKEYRRLAKSVGEEPVRTNSLKSPPLPVNLYDRIADANCAALLQLCEIQGFKSDSAWIARQLDVAEPYLKWLIALMIKAGVLAWKDGELCKVEKTDPQKQLSIFQKEQHLESLRLAIDSLDAEDPGNYCLDGLELRVDPSRLPAARALIRRFVEELADTLKSEGDGAVFRLGIHFSQIHKK